MSVIIWFEFVEDKSLLNVSVDQVVLCDICVSLLVSPLGCSEDHYDHAKCVHKRFCETTRQEVTPCTASIRMKPATKILHWAMLILDEK